MARKKSVPKRICSGCKKKREIAYKIPEGDFCHVCYNKTYRPKYSCTQPGCKTKKAAHSNKFVGPEQNQSRCPRCYKKYHQPRYTCTQPECQSPENITAEAMVGPNKDQPVCKPCYVAHHQPKHRCASCEEEKPAVKRLYDNKGQIIGYLCSPCNSRRWRKIRARQQQDA